MSGWTLRTIDDICEFRGGGTPSKSNASYWKGTIPWVSPKDMKSDVVSDSIDHVSAQAVKKSTTNLIPAGSILVVVRSGILARTIPIAITGGEVTINQDIKALCPNASVDSMFLFYFLKSRLGEMLGLASRGATVHRIMADQIRTMEIGVPPLPEQRRIVAILDEAFAAIATAKANTEQNLANARAVFESHLQGVFTQRGDGWVERPLGEVAEFKNGLNFNQGSQGQSVRIVGVADFQDHYVVPTDDLESVTIDGELDKGYQIRDGDLLTVRSNGSKSLVGRCMMVPPISGVVSYSGFVIRIRCDQRAVLPAFLLHFMKSSDTRDRLTRDGGGTNISNINQGKLSALTLSLPPMAEQRQVVRRLDGLMAETQRLESLAQRKLSALDALKASLLHHAFTGQLGERSHRITKELVDA